jgi:hypothetical protein
VCRVPFSCFSCPDSFSAAPRGSGPVFMFCAPGLIFGGTEGVGYRFHVLHSRTHFRRYRGRRVPFSCFSRTDLFSVVPRASAPVFMFCAPGLNFGDTEGVGSHFHVLRSRTQFPRYRGRRLPSAPGLIFRRNKGVWSCFHVLRSLTHFRRYRGRRLPYSFSAVLRASAPVFIFSVPRLVFGVTEGVGSRLLVLRSWKHFWRNRGRRLPVSCYACPDSCSTVPRASDPVFMFCTPKHIFGGTKGIRFSSHVLRSRTQFRRYRGHRLPFHVLHARTRF